MLTTGELFAHYEVLGLLGAGGMGQVFSALDTRLEREVALKVLHEAMTGDAVRVRRFENEARAASALNHPNIVTIHDIGSSGGVAYIAMERVEGRTLRKMMSADPMPTKALVRLAAQIAEGLAGAHAAGIVHRDLKPENVMVTREGLVKILDFGLAKLTLASDDGSGPEARVDTETYPGSVVGTVGYMSPEQAAGGAADFRSDQFSFGSILYELATGVRAFHRPTSVETLTAILNEEPKPIAELSPGLPVPLRWIVERCLAKDPERRYASTRDLARDLETLRDRSAEAGIPPASTRGNRTAATRVALAALAAVVVGLGLFAGRRLTHDALSPAAFQRLTYRRGLVTGARFSEDGQNVVFSARWGGEPERLFLSRIGGPESLSLPLPDGTRLLGMSHDGSLALALRASPYSDAPARGTLALAPLAGGSPRELRGSVQSADFAGDVLAVVVDGRLEFPPGTVLYKGGLVGRVRASPTGDRFAILEERDGELSVSVIDRAGRRTRIASTPAIAQAGAMSSYHHGLAWNPDGLEVLFSGGVPGAANSILAATMAGKVRTVLRLPPYVALEDVSRDGRLLVAQGDVRSAVLFRPRGEGPERDLAWFAMSSAIDVSADGKTILLAEYGEAGDGATYLRKTDGSPAVKIRESDTGALSPDGSWLARVDGGKGFLVPTGAGESRTLARDGFAYEDVAWFPDGRRLLVAGREGGRGLRLFVQDASGGELRPLTEEGIVSHGPISPDGSAVTVERADGHWIDPTTGGPGRRLPGVEPGERLAAWSPDGRSVLATVEDRPPFAVYRIDVRDGSRELWKTIEPADPAGVCSAQILLTSDGTSALTLIRWINDLYVVEGVR